MKRIHILLILLVVSIAIIGVGDNKRKNFYNKSLQAITDSRLMLKENIGVFKLQLGEKVDKKVYQNNILAKDENGLDYSKDVKKVYNGEKFSRLMDYPNGYIVDLPEGSEYDFTLSPNYTKVKNKYFEAMLAREWSPYDDVKWYFDNYPNRYLINNEYLTSNNITVHKNETVRINGRDVLIISLTRKPFAENNKPNTYTYVYFYTDSREYYRIMFKGYEYNDDYIRECERTINSFDTIIKRGKAEYSVNWQPELPNWDEATKKLFADLENTNKFKWGIFTRQSMTEGVDYRIADLEKKIDYKFDIVLGYMCLYEPLPIYGMKKARDDGKAIELTVQVSNMENAGLFGKNPNLEMYDGLKDDQIRRLAKQIKEFGSPILFRLNNEMNSDWTNYSGIAALSDADISKDNWVRIYNIFQEENVTNCIWVYNPNDKNCPPCNWNSFAAYYPGNKSVHMLGGTGYNTGSYYNQQWAEKWSSFTEIYDYIAFQYNPLFSKFIWIITEFGSSSVGGDKVKWIDEMFANLHKYPNIKAAVWWSSADYDVTPDKKSIPARRYWLDETPETGEAFKRGLKQQQ